MTHHGLRSSRSIAPILGLLHRLNLAIRGLSAARRLVCGENSTDRSSAANMTRQELRRLWN